MDDHLSRAQWRKSSFSGNTGNCVEVAVTQSSIGIRDSKEPEGGVLLVRGDEWRRFVMRIRGNA
jgi:hypothetical protein